MTIDDRSLEVLLEESQDRHADAMRQSAAALPDLKDAAADARSIEVDPAVVGDFDESRRRSASGMIGAGLLAGGVGAALAALMAQPAAADGGNQNRWGRPLDIACLQTASGLEVLAVATYGAALQIPFIAEGNPVIVKFAQTTMQQHDAHRRAFQAQTSALGGTPQTGPNPIGKALVDATVPKLQSPIDVVTLAMTLETIATNTYLNNLAFLTNLDSVDLFGSIQGVECQHLATLRAVAALIKGGAPELIAIPVDPTKLPAAAGSVAFPLPFEPTTLAANPEEGAL